MANYNILINFDFETGGKLPKKSQPLSLSAVAIDPVRLEIIRGSEFNSYIRPVFEEEECIKLGIEPIQDEALDVNKITREQLQDAPSLQEVWSRFVEHCSKYNSGKGKWSKPIPTGYNILGFDNLIVHEICKRYGPWDSERECQDIFHPRDCIDVMHIVWNIFERDKNTRSISFDTVRNHFGLSKDGAHSSLVDVQQCSMFLIRWMRWLRKSMPKNLQNSMKDCMIEDFYESV